MGFNPTPNQAKVLDSKGKNIVISASAGSGKTTLMLEKVIKIITSENIDISKFLMCTFTKNAGDEMKQRLQIKLAECIASEKDEKKRKILLDSYENIELAKISTIDKLCLDIVKKYFYKLNLSPNIEIMSDFQKGYLRDVAFKMSLSKMEKQDKTKVDKLCDYFLQNRDLVKLNDLTMSLYDSLKARDDMREYLKTTAIKLYNEDIKSSEMLNFFTTQLDNLVSETMGKLQKIYACEQADNAESTLLPNLENMMERLKYLQACDLETKLHNAMNFKNGEVVPPADTLTRKSTTFKEDFKVVREVFNKKLDKIVENIITEDFDELAKRNENTKEMIVLLMDFIMLFIECYDKLKETQNQFEFSDLQHYALRLLCENKDILNDFTKDLKYIFVDEYQDVNYLQEKLIDTIAQNGKLFLVGDVKQSIYKFRLCTPEILMRKQVVFDKDENSELHSLNDNFRTDKTICEFNNDIFSVIMNEKQSGVDYAGKHKLAWKNEFINETNDDKVKVDIILKKSEEKDGKSESLPIYDITSDTTQTSENEDEANHIVSVVKKLIQQKIYDDKVGGLRQVTFKDIAILFRKRQDFFKLVVEKLRANNVPVTVSYKQDIFSSVEVQFVNALLKLLVNFEDDISLATVLAFPAVNMTDGEFALIREAYPQETYFSNAVLLYLNAYEANQTSESAVICQKLKKVVNFIADLRQDIYVYNVYDIIKKCEKYFDLENILYALKMPKIVSNYKKFLSEVATMKTLNVVEYLEYLSSRGKLESEIGISDGDDSVICQTIHASKGLEYPIVIVAGCGSDFKSKYDDVLVCDYGIGCDYYNLEDKLEAKTLVKNYIKEREHLQDVEEGKRLLYVALTRAKNKLYITGEITVNAFMDSYENRRTPNDLQYILSILQSFEKEALLKKFENRQVGNDCTGSITLKKENALFEIVDSVEVEDVSEWAFVCDINDIDLTDVGDYINYEYKYKQNFEVAYKNSVSAILFSEKSESGENFTETPKRLSINENDGTFAPDKVGTAYHSVLEKIDFKKNYSNEDISAIISTVDVEGIEDVKVEVLQRCITNINALVESDDEILKEQPFIFKAKYADVVTTKNAEKCEEKILVQGVIDLMIRKPSGKIIIVDYKHTNTKDEKVLIERYRKQLELYKYATVLDGGTAENISTYLYSIKYDKLIRVD